MYVYTHIHIYKDIFIHAFNLLNIYLHMDRKFLEGYTRNFVSMATSGDKSSDVTFISYSPVRLEVFLSINIIFIMKKPS